MKKSREKLLKVRKLLGKIKVGEGSSLPSKDVILRKSSSKTSDHLETHDGRRPGSKMTWEQDDLGTDGRRPENHGKGLMLDQTWEQWKMTWD